MKEINQLIQEKFNTISKSGKLFRVDVSGEDIWMMYLLGFSSKTNPVFRDPASTTHNCNHCKHFIKRYGNIVAIIDNRIETMFDIDAPEEYKHSMKFIAKAIKGAKIENVFFESFANLSLMGYEKVSQKANLFQLGIPKNHKVYTQEEADKFPNTVEVGKVYTFSHFSLQMPKAFITTESVEAIQGKYRDNKNVLKRGLDEISLDTLNLIKDLFIQKSLLNGDMYIQKLDSFLELKKAYEEVHSSEKDNWCWRVSYDYPYSKFRNELIGVLCVDIETGVDLSKACIDWNKRIDPANFMKAVAPIPKAKLEAARKYIQENGYEASFLRRMATLDDISISEILHVNNANAIKPAISIFDSVAVESKGKASFEGVQEMDIDKFMKEVLPNCTSVEAFVDNKHSGNLVALTTALHPDSKPIFKWDNPYSYTYENNLSGKSMIEENVKKFGGKTEGILRASIQWADGNADNSDLDLHCSEPLGHIYYAHALSPSGGNLDVDIRTPNGKLAVENIVFPDPSKMKEGNYRFYVHQFSARNSKGFSAEIVVEGMRYNYQVNTAIANKDSVNLATVTYSKGEFSIKHHLTPVSMEAPSFKKWGIQSGEFHKVNMVCLSPNYWGDNAVGNKNYFFMLEKCKPDVAIRGVHNDHLLSALLPYRQVLDAVGDSVLVQPDENALAGIGFNSTVKDSVILKLKGTFNRVLKINF